MRNHSLISALASLVLVPCAQAKVPWIKQARDLGIAEIKDCKSCHGERNAKDSLNPAGQWLLAQKAARKAAECQVVWMKDYFATRK